MNNIILIGFMGCGKTSIGSKLSYRIQRKFIDTDKWIEKRHGKLISDIFKEEGEAYFRKLETECLTELQKQKDNSIIAAGGGLPLKKENQVLLHSLGHIIYLRAEFDTIYQRLNSDMTRPLLQGGDPGDRIKELLNSRSSIYLEASDILIDTDGKEFERIVEEIQEVLKENEIIDYQRT